MITFHVMIQFKAFILLSNPSQISKINAMVTFLLLINSESTGLFAPSTALEDVPPPPYVKLDPDIPES